MSINEGRVWAEIYLDRLINNYNIIKTRAKNIKIMAAIKADAYGHGAIEVARTLEGEKISMFGVASVEEGIELRQAGVTSKILVLSPIPYGQADAVVEYRLIPTISETGFLKVLDKKLRQVRQPMPIHIEIDTGMTRTGFNYQEAKDAIRQISSMPHIKIEGIFSHFPLADTDGAFTKRQIAEFEGLVRDLRRVKIYPSLFHLANSAGMFRYSQSHFNLVRPGIALYGLRPASDFKSANNLEPVMALKSRVVNIHNVAARTAISYGHTYRTRKKSQIATVSIGYGDGYPRALSNIGEVLIHRKRVPIVGTICMDLIMIDVTSIKGVKVGDIVTLIGNDGRDEISADECARKANTIVYEITSGIGPRVARVFKINNKVISVRNLLGRWRN